MAQKSAGIITLKFEALTKGLEKGFDEAGKKAEGFGKKASKIGGDMVVVGAGMAAIGGAITGVSGIAVNAFANFDDKMRATNAVMGGTREDLDRMTASAKDFGATTPHSASAVADAFRFMGMAGWKAGQSIDAMEGFLSLASATGLDLASTSDILTDSMTVFGIQAEKAGGVSDSYAKIQSMTNTSVLQLGEAMKYAGPSANAMGLTLDQTNKVLGVFGDNALKGSIGGTTFTSMMNDMTKRNRDGTLMLENLGVAVFDSNGKMRDTFDIMRDLQGATKGMSSEARELALGPIFGDQSIKGVNALLNTSEERFLQLENGMANASGTAGRMAGEMEDGVGGGIRSMQSAIEGATIEIGEALAPVVIALIPHIIGLTQSVIGFVQANPQLIQIVAVVGGVLLGLGSVLLTVGGAIMGVVKFVGSLISIWGVLKGAAVVIAGVIGAVSTPVWLVIGAIAAVIAIGVLLWKNWDWIGQKASEVWSWISTKTAEGINKAKSSVDSGIRGIKNTFKSGMDFILDLIFPVIRQIERLGDLAGGIGKTVGGAVGRVKGIIPGFANGGVIGNRGIPIQASNGDNRLIAANSNEAVVNPKQAVNILDKIMNGGDFGGKSNQGETKIEIYAQDSESFERYMKKNAFSLKKILKLA